MKKKIERTERGYIVGLGEMTGHAHTIQENIDLYEDDGVMFMETFCPVTIRHEEHRPLTIE
jgi:hypothetical protein